jgi:mRNA guanylyltransferase
MELEPDRRIEWEQNPPDQKIVECRYDPEWPNRWRFSRWRDDKLTANHISVYEKIMQSIADNVTEEQVALINVAIRSCP